MTNGFGDKQLRARAEEDCFGIYPAPVHGKRLAAMSVSKRAPQNTVTFLSHQPLVNNLLSALPREDFARLRPHLEPVTLNAGDDLDGAGCRYAHFIYLFG